MEISKEEEKLLKAILDGKIIYKKDKTGVESIMKSFSEIDTNNYTYKIFERCPFDSIKELEESIPVSLSKSRPLEFRLQDSDKIYKVN